MISTTKYAPDIPDDEDEVESGQNSRHKVDILRRALEVVVASVDGVRGGKYRRTTARSTQ